MANASKRINKTNVEPQITPTNFYCCKCGIAYSRQKGYFPVTHSSMYQGSGYLPWCNDCLDKMYEVYLVAYDSGREAMRRMCMKLDLYWHPDLFELASKTKGAKSFVRNYIGRGNLYKYLGKSFDDTINEDNGSTLGLVNISESAKLLKAEQELEEARQLINPETVSFWGTGFAPDFYFELERKYKTWTDSLSNLDPGEQAIYKQICILEATINRDSAAGKAIDKNVNALNTLLGSANLKPAQRKADDIDEELDNMPLGVGIHKWENTRPVPEPDPELQDVDGIVRYITVWFLGHLCKMLGIKNSYCKLYEEEMERRRVRAPKFEDNDDEDDALFDYIFGESAAQGNE